MKNIVRLINLEGTDKTDAPLYVERSVSRWRWLRYIFIVLAPDNHPPGSKGRVHYFKLDISKNRGVLKNRQEETKYGD